MAQDSKYFVPLGQQDGQWLGVLATKADDLSSIPGTHMAEGRYRLLKVVL